MTVDEWLVAAGLVMACGGWIMAMVFGPLRVVFADGWRCICRHRVLIWTPALLGVVYAAFRIAREWQARAMLSGAGQSAWPLPGWEWTALDWHAAAGSALGETAARVAGTFHVAVSAGPVATILAVLLLFNWGGSCRALWHSALRRFPRYGRLIAGAFLVVGAPALAVRFGLFFALDYFGDKDDARQALFAAGIIDAVGWLFEHLAGVFIQVALLLIASSWVRGVHIERAEFAEFAMRRFVAVLPWVGVLAALAFIILQLPLLATGYHPAGLAAVLHWLPAGALALHAFTAVFATMQIRMALEDRGLRFAMQDNARFLRSHGRHLLWFVVLTGLPAFGFATVVHTFLESVGEWTWVELTLRLGAPCGWGVLSGWWLASWVCLFRACEVDRLEKRIEY